MTDERWHASGGLADPLSEEVVLKDPELQHVLKGVDAKRVCAIFTREEPLPFANLVSSDLDADRIDYLVRTAHHTGLPYGNVDLDYIISQMRLDDARKLCLTSKAVRAADHFLLCRFFDYQQVAYHKTVAGFELVLKDVLEQLIRTGELSGAADAVSKSISEQTWADFDDASVVNVMRRKLKKKSTNEVLKRKIESLIMRRAPKLICERESIGARTESEKLAFLLLRRTVKEHLPAWAAASGIDEKLWYVWDRAGLALTKIGSSVPLTALVEHDEEDEEAIEQTIRILEPHGLKSTPIVELNHSLMKSLSNSALYSLRVYVLVPETDSVARAKRQRQIENLIKKDLPEAAWK